MSDSPTYQPLRLRVVYDEDGQNSQDGCDGKPLPESEAVYTAGPYMKDGRPVPYAEYLQYYGNPDRHIVVGVELQRQCRCCQAWTHVDSLWGIDFMDDSPELRVSIGTIHWSAEADALAWPGYLAQVAKEMIEQTRSEE